MVASCVEAPFAQMLRDMAAEADRNTGRTFPQIWETQTESCFPQLPLKKEDKALLTEFARSLGYADRCLQEQAIDNQSAALHERIRELETHRAEREKMVMSFGLMGGLLLVIVLL